MANVNMVVYRELKDGDAQAYGSAHEFAILCNGASMCNVASFRTEWQLQQFCDLIGVTYEWDELSPGFKVGRCSHTIERDAKDREVEEEYHMNLVAAHYGTDGGERVSARKWLDDYGMFGAERSAYSITEENLRRAKIIKALSNGSIVDCYVTNYVELVRIYRCNPNSKKFYNPLKHDEHTRFADAHGIY